MTEQTKTEKTAWLIERTERRETEYVRDICNWTTNRDNALRFETSEKAVEFVLRNGFDLVAIVQHSWIEKDH